jgi:hypothetical protein
MVQYIVNICSLISPQSPSFFPERLYGIYGGQNGTWVGFTPEYFSVSLSVIPPSLHTGSHYQHCMVLGTGSDRVSKLTA